MKNTEKYTGIRARIHKRRNRNIDKSPFTAKKQYRYAIQARASRIQVHCRGVPAWFANPMRCSLRVVNALIRASQRSNAAVFFFLPPVQLNVTWRVYRNTNASTGLYVDFRQIEPCKHIDVRPLQL